MAPPPTSPTMTVLAFARSTSGFYFGELLAGLTQEVAAAGGRVVVVQTLDPGDTADVVVNTPAFDTPVAWDQVDGAVAVSLAAGAPYLHRLREQGTPVVLASNWVDGFDAPLALPDNRAGTAAAVEHLIAHGHTRIGFVGNLTQTDMRERYSAFVDVLAQHDLPHDESLFFETADNAEPGGRGVAQAVASATDRPTALMVATDRNALGLLDGLADLGVSVPGDLAVIGFDNIEAGAFSTPSLSSVSQRFDAVGALAGRLVVASIRGEQVSTSAHTPAQVTIAARGSCGCTGDILDIGARATGAGAHLGAGALAAPPGPIRPAESPDDHDPAALDAVRAVDRMLAQGEEPSAEQLRGLVTALRQVGAYPDLVHRVANAATEHVQRTATGTGPPAGAAAPEPSRIAAALWQVQAGSYLRRSQLQERLLTEQFRVAAGLLDTSAQDARSLSWLSGTHVRAGVLALWDGDPGSGRLTVAGTYGDRGRVLASLEGTAMAVGEFPPRSIVDRTRPDRRDVCFVVPVRNREHDWGLLAVVGDIDTTSSRDTYHHWAQLVCSAFEGEALQQQVRQSEERYAHATRAANDGLWEWDVATRHLYLSERCAELLGLPRDARPDPETWLDAVAPEDRGVVDEARTRALARPGVPVEVEYRTRTADGAHRWRLGRWLAIAEDGAAARVVGSLSDIHQRKELEEQLRHGALHDALTGLPNRRLFLERLGRALEQRRRRPDTEFAVVFLDLDGFKLVNDSLGHLMGDELLRRVGNRLRSQLRAVDTAARFGGDEFAVLLYDLDPDGVLGVVARIQEAVAAPILLGEHEVAVTASVGITTSHDGYARAEDVLRDADTAMYHAKDTERGTASIFDPDMHERASGRLMVRSELRTALTEGQFVVHYQPIVALDGTGVSHFEALVRWQHPERGLLLPGAFLPDLEDSGAVVAMGRWLIAEVCRQIAAWREDHAAPVTVSVNVSHREFWADGLVAAICGSLEQHHVPPELLVLELTETVIMSDPEAARHIMTELRRTGVELHIDDFGTGQSSLHALRTLPVDTLKIDGSFVRDLVEDAGTGELVRTIVEMGRALGLSVVAECVETAEQARRLQAMGCTRAQGWLYAKALPGAAAGDLIGRPLGRSDVLTAG